MSSMSLLNRSSLTLVYMEPPLYVFSLALTVSAFNASRAARCSLRRRIPTPAEEEGPLFLYLLR
jgi:hypothetical protein